jgi:hypothetical protein
VVKKDESKAAQTIAPITPQSRIPPCCAAIEDDAVADGNEAAIGTANGAASVAAAKPKRENIALSDAGGITKADASCFVALWMSNISLNSVRTSVSCANAANRRNSSLEESVPSKKSAIISE